MQLCFAPMKIEILHPCLAAQAHREPGTILDLPEAEAHAVLSTGRARRVASSPAPAPETAAAAPALETAAATPATETAAKRPARTKRTVT